MCVQAPFVFSSIFFPASQTATTVLLGSQTWKTKKPTIWHKCDRCLHKGLSALVSTARFMCSLSPLIMQGSAPIISAFPASITRKFKHHQLCCTWEKKKYQNQLKLLNEERENFILFPEARGFSLLLWITQLQSHAVASVWTGRCIAVS